MSLEKTLSNLQTEEYELEKEYINLEKVRVLIFGDTRVPVAQTHKPPRLQRTGRRRSSSSGPGRSRTMVPSCDNRYEQQRFAR